MLLLPESPIWLRSKNRADDANESAKWLGLPETQLKDVQRHNEQSQSEKISYLSRPILLPLAVGLTLLVLQQISGIDAIIFFTVEIFRASG